MSKFSSKVDLQKYFFRNLKISDFFQLHKMYDSLDNEKTKPFFNLYWLGFKKKSPKWFLAQIPLFLSTIRIFRRIVINLYPYVIFLSKVAIKGGKIISYGFLIIRKRFDKKNFSAELGVVVVDNYQRRGIGSIMIEELIKFAKEERIKEIFLTTRVDNIKAQKLYKKFNFSIEKLLKNEVEWQGKKYDMYKMSLVLS